MSIPSHFLFKLAKKKLENVSDDEELLQLASNEAAGVRTDLNCVRQENVGIVCSDPPPPSVAIFPATLMSL